MSMVNHETTAVGTVDLRTVRDYRERARELLEPHLFDNMFGTDDDAIGRTDNSNRAAFESLAFRPRILRDVSSRSLATTVLGQRLEVPIMLGPIGDARRVHPDGELATIRAANAAGISMVLSMVSSVSATEIIEAASGPVWTQLYVLKDRAATGRLVEHLAEVGSAALVVTVDNPGIISKDVNVGRPPQDWGTLKELGILETLAVRRSMIENIDPAVTWKDIDWLRSLTQLPIVLKGIRTPEDATLCREHGVDGLVLSNHGGHTLGDQTGTVARLPEIVEAAGETEVYLDGGIREGADVLAALALGARAVLLGRAQYWGLTVAGEAGLTHVLEILRRELDKTMMFCGVTDLQQVDHRLLTSVVGDRFIE
jgi:4-hydroxymandelate oxidase